MCTISNTVERKFTHSIDLCDLEIETDSGWHPVVSIHKTIPYTVWQIKTSAGLTLECADTHIVFDQEKKEIFVKDLIEGSTRILTQFGPDLVVAVSKLDRYEAMFDVAVDHADHSFYSNGILSHNTTIVNALSYALFGQALTNIKKNNLINKTNGKNMIVTLSFAKDGVEYYVERGRSPTFLKFFVDHRQREITDESQGDSRETQAFINNLLNMSHDMFKQIVALNTYSEPFLSLKAADQRDIIEQLLGITILSEKAAALKEQIRDSKDLIIAETARIRSIEDSNRKIQSTIEHLKSTQSSWKLKKAQDCAAIKNAIRDLQTLDIDQELALHDAKAHWQDLNNQKRLLEKDKNTHEVALLQAQTQVSDLNKEISKLETQVCYACGQHFSGDSQTKLLEDKKNLLEQATFTCKEHASKLDSVISGLARVGVGEKPCDTFYETVGEAYQHLNNIEQLKQSLKIKEDEQDPYQLQIEQLGTNALQIIDWNKVNELQLLRDHQEFLLKLLTNKDSFIRKKIIDQNLSFLNSRLTTYLSKLGLPHQVIFLNDLSVQITQLGQDLDFDNLSRGERNRLILGLSFSFRDVWESLYDNINLLFIDELIDSGLDSAGIECSLGALKALSRERQKNIFLISHKEELVSRVNCILRVIKEGGFTSYSNDVEYTN